MGGDAAIAYRPEAAAPVPERYSGYDIASVHDLPVGEEDCIVAPETLVRELPLRSPAERHIWWLSFDFFTSRRPTGAGRFIANSYKSALIQVMTIFGVRHLFQSDYARLRLAERKVEGVLLSDYLSTEANPVDSASREDMILYNPKKGLAVTEMLRESCPGLTFVPIINMNKEEVEQTFRRAKIYIDFGEHPGKDRLPREAAALGVVVIVGARGSAANDQDVPLAARYKLAIDATLRERFPALIADIFSDFDRHRSAQDPYRSFIAGERAAFTQQVRDIFFVRVGTTTT
ncbi:hypothetical protein [Methylobacterium sp. J-077]|uniref:hypothetical protein n=1 Tax=Methylobacterium sp. J-077 TaxID=2836656 RepID=UPI001FBBA1C2|nr:hypothetical protein [Methylobacterium sp. J-077]MCJ2121688.1 hypothetical protein [Methylobacterium sp. J-077]